MGVELDRGSTGGMHTHSRRPWVVDRAKQTEETATQEADVVHSNVLIASCSTPGQ